MADEKYSLVIKLLRTKFNMKQVDLAKAVGVSASLVSQWESGWRSPSHIELLKMAEVFKVTVDYILTGKPTQKRAEELEQLKTVQYDFYKYINREYDLKENPELIREHFEYLESNPEKCKEIPPKFGIWNIVKQIKHMEYDKPAEVGFLLKEILGKEYIFNVITQFSCWMGVNDYKQIGSIRIKIDFSRDFPRYCGEINFDIPEQIIIDFSKSRPSSEAFYNNLTWESQKGKMEKYLMRILLKLCCKVFDVNNIDNAFLITDSKENKFTIRESETRKMNYVIITKTDNNNIFWNYRFDEISISDDDPIRVK